jgi:lactate dehydrogenase-like 2-hydroxyacid dehydrogenase
MSTLSTAEERKPAAAERETTSSATALDRRLRVMVQRHPVLRPEEHDALLRAHPGVETVLATTDDECERAAAQADGAMVFGWRPEDLTTRAPRLRWLQLMIAGIDGLPRSILDSPLVITATKGPMAPPMAEHAVTLLLALARRLPTFLVQDQATFFGMARWIRGAAEVGAGAPGQLLMGRPALAATLSESPPLRSH